MKKAFSILALVAILAGFCGTANAQAPYKHSIGGTVGSMEAFSYKTFIGDHFAFQIDAGYKLTLGASKDFNLTIYDVEANPNFMYEGNFTKGLYGFIGGGVSLGYCWNLGGWDYYNYYSRHHGLGKFGVNAIMGLEYKFNIPLTLQFDFRPGYGLLFDDDPVWNYFDWGLNVGVRYTFH